MKSIVTKIAISVLGAGTVATGVAFAVNHSEDKNNYENHLNKQGRKLIKDNSDHWNTARVSYNAEGDDLLITLNNKRIEKNQLELQDLKNWCSQNSKKSFTDTKDAIYQRVSAWCTEPKTIESQIEKGKVILDDTEPSGSVTANKHETNWGSKVTNYNLSGNTDLINEISGDREGAIIQINSGITTQKLRSWCRHIKLKNFKHEEEKRYLTYLKWCTN